MTGTDQHEDGVVQEMAYRLAQREAERLEQELMGAWRAGYDYLDVISKDPMESLGEPGEYTYHVPGTVYIPAYDLGEDPADIYPSKYRVERYDLDVETKKVRELIECG